MWPTILIKNCGFKCLCPCKRDEFWEFLKMSKIALNPNPIPRLLDGCLGSKYVGGDVSLGWADVGLRLVSCCSWFALNAFFITLSFNSVSAAIAFDHQLVADLGDTQAIPSTRLCNGYWAAAIYNSAGITFLVWHWEYDGCAGSIVDAWSRHPMPSLAAHSYRIPVASLLVAYLQNCLRTSHKSSLQHWIYSTENWRGFGTIGKNDHRFLIRLSGFWTNRPVGCTVVGISMQVARLEITSNPKRLQLQ